MTVSSNDPRPSYVQVADSLREAIRSGELPPGTRLPSGRELATQFGVALMTAQKAVDALRAEHLVRSHRGRGVFVADDSAVPEDDLATLRADMSRLADRVAELERRVGVDNDSR
ncbi:transcriptional regulator, GntR family [Kribbella flavida DSM 17836]|uniref:Transcriptional regulator, GntR family n=1 Tax=Kribbella flavida (strain DSM 17836 / JCM 10339 / NBRC 14399) TaxID=479435 RepID=D2PSD4_KRIFD|nr:winged helix-turn-helix domain-containing protein [Kribbella flavida]ADB31258.1 transcriptional regulator, GntR family [Kribbella flavida DSM 17836]